MTQLSQPRIVCADEWTKVEDAQPRGECLVWLERNHLGSRLHTANFSSNVKLVGNHFHFNMPRVTHWMPAPSGPVDHNQ